MLQLWAEGPSRDTHMCVLLALVVWKKCLRTKVSDILGGFVKSESHPDSCFVYQELKRQSQYVCGNGRHMNLEHARHGLQMHPAVHGRHAAVHIRPSQNWLRVKHVPSIRQCTQQMSTMCLVGVFLWCQDTQVMKWGGWSKCLLPESPRSSVLLQTYVTCPRAGSQHAANRLPVPASGIEKMWFQLRRQLTNYCL